jgi:hypothetical protein
MANHENRHGAKRDTQPAHKTEKISAIELIGTEKGQDNRDNREDQAHHERVLRYFSYYLRRRQI